LDGRSVRLGKIKVDLKEGNYHPIASHFQKGLHGWRSIIMTDKFGHARLAVGDCTNLPIKPALVVLELLPSCGSIKNEAGKKLPAGKVQDEIRKKYYT